MFALSCWIVGGLFKYTFSLRCAHRKKSGAVKSGDLGGHGKSEFREIIRS